MRARRSAETTDEQPQDEANVEVTVLYDEILYKDPDEPRPMIASKGETVKLSESEYKRLTHKDLIRGPSVEKVSKKRGGRRSQAQEPAGEADPNLEAPPDLEDMDPQELLELAGEKGVTVESSDDKDSLIAKLRAADQG